MKYIYWLVVQGDYGHGYEDLDQVNKHWDTELCGPKYASKTMTVRGTEGFPHINSKPVTPVKYAKYLLGEYRFATPNASYRIINRREKNT